MHSFHLISNWFSRKKQWAAIQIILLCYMWSLLHVRSAKNLISGDKQNVDSTRTINQVASEQPPKFQLRSEDILIQYQRMFNYDVYTPPTTAGTLREMTLYIAAVLRKSYPPCF